MTIELINAILDINPPPVYIGPIVEKDGCVVPLYIDTVPITFWPKSWHILTRELIQETSDIDYDVVAGAFTGGVPIAAGVAYQLKKRFCWVRKEAKGYSQNRVVDGMLGAGDRVVLFDDFFVRGKVKEQFIVDLEKTGAKVVAVCAVGIRHEAFTQVWAREHKVELRYLLTQREVADELVTRKIITPQLREIVGAFIQNPYGWQKDKKLWQIFLIERERHKHLELKAS